MRGFLNGVMKTSMSSITEGRRRLDAHKSRHARIAQESLKTNLVIDRRKTQNATSKRESCETQILNSQPERSDGERGGTITSSLEPLASLAKSPLSLHAQCTESGGVDSLSRQSALNDSPVWLGAWKGDFVGGISLSNQ